MSERQTWVCLECWNSQTWMLVFVWSSEGHQLSERRCVWMSDLHSCDTTGKKRCSRCLYHRFLSPCCLPFAYLCRFTFVSRGGHTLTCLLRDTCYVGVYTDADLMWHNKPECVTCTHSKCTFHAGSWMKICEMVVNESGARVKLFIPVSWHLLRRHTLQRWML